MVKSLQLLKGYKQRIADGECVHPFESILRLENGTLRQVATRSDLPLLEGDYFRCRSGHVLRIVRLAGDEWGWAATLEDGATRRIPSPTSSRQTYWKPTASR
jgi:hypothetical protein